MSVKQQFVSDTPNRVYWVKAFALKHKESAFGGDFMWQCCPSMLPMQFGILQMLLNSSAIRSHSSGAETATHTHTHIYVLDAAPSKCLLSCSFQLENSNPKTQMIPQWQDTYNIFF